MPSAPRRRRRSRTSPEDAGWLSPIGPDPRQGVGDEADGAARADGGATTREQSSRSAWRTVRGGPRPRPVRGVATARWAGHHGGLARRTVEARLVSQPRAPGIHAPMASSRSTEFGSFGASVPRWSPVTPARPRSGSRRRRRSGRSAARAGRARLAAQVLDVRVDRPLVRLEGHAVDRSSSCERVKIRPGLAGQRREELELGGGQLDRRPATEDRIRGKSSARSPARMRRRRLGRRRLAAQDRPHPGDELAGLKGLVR